MDEMHTDYDVEGIVKDLRDNKYSDDEIKGFLKDKFGDQTVGMYFPEKGTQTITSPAPQESEILKPAAIATAGRWRKRSCSTWRSRPQHIFRDIAASACRVWQSLRQAAPVLHERCRCPSPQLPQH